MADRPLTLRALNRATLARQLLLARERIPALRAVERVAGFQAQLARLPFIGLWSRVEGFRREELIRLAAARAVVRGPLMRATLHLVSAADYLRFRGPLQPVLDGAARVVAERLAEVDVARIVAAARAFLEEEPRTFDELRPLLAARFPGLDPRAMAYAARMKLPLVQVPSDVAWGFHGSARFTMAEAWLGEPIPDGRSPEALVVRYLAAFGPATAADAQAWSGLARLEGVLAALRPKLRSVRDEDGRELLDLPHAPRPPEDTPAPVRFLPEWDNLLLGHADRRRVVSIAHRKAIVTKNLLVPPTFLVDGFVSGTWQIAGKGARARLELKPFAPLARRSRDALMEEGERLVRFVEGDADEARASTAAAEPLRRRARASSEARPARGPRPGGTRGARRTAGRPRSGR
ncbi:winged helix DNA-binding domain-containing protein [Anaeromyxobacter sp. Fw109-5]|uniref:winged helix DNA-binding domain-containing protein n=1 Tax=Anaeromyxobacter sp. (strain Fw109-5) TaxID=404589 RepID=UPI0000ED6FC6|nr:winged helix DNA-binding domain-containing protein [Anaeromyxobacter sp. Fw109-5]ABS27693.1 conserved hypothetical protein [Anaeromyxobacter sp. Fw109-5]